ncbi:hypothetical protein EST38_g612 [Candolleomyces aberdarensis]|uniref:MARVEL domain-containing protein n=1 Tax=Candolleomyces aberdarensis TaxID=2316362 RepID=A0A4Q2DY60_9AGAR|nr:hypothetical protein EST38_g612 [Candolleomyces aberdarensis]
MTVRFGNRRLAFYIWVFLLSGTVLGLTANFLNLFGVPYNSGFNLFAIIVTSLQIFIFLLSLQWSQPNVEAFILFFFGVLWLAMGAWATDIVGHEQCSQISGRLVTKGGAGTKTARSFCNEMKVVQAFSWALFASFLLAEYVLFQLIGQAKRFGRWDIGREPIRELPWFDEQPGYYNTHTGGVPGHAPHSPGYFPGHPGYGYPPMSQGQTTIIQPGMNGAPATVTTVPMSA